MSLFLNKYFNGLNKIISILLGISIECLVSSHIFRKCRKILWLYFIVHRYHHSLSFFLMYFRCISAAIGYLMSTLFTYLFLPKLLQWLPLNAHSSGPTSILLSSNFLTPLLKILWCFSVGWIKIRHTKMICKVLNYLQLPSNFPSH